MSTRALCHWALGLTGLVAAGFLASPVTARGSGQGSGNIGDFVWRDLDGDGVQDAAEPGIPGVKLTLLPAGPGGDLGIFNATTDARGLYHFDNVPTNATYRVSVDASNFSSGGPLAGLVPTLSFRGDTKTDSNGGRPIITLSDNGVTATADLDFGFGPCSTCVGGATSLSIRYVGSLTGAQVQASGLGVLASQIMNPGDIINVDGAGGAPIGNLLTMTVNGQVNAVFDTSCACCSGPQASVNIHANANASAVAGILQQLGASVSRGTGYDLNGDGRISMDDLNRALTGESTPTPPFNPPLLADTTLLEERFEGSAVGWEMNGLWAITPGCRTDPVCDGNRWAYFGSENGCNYATGTPRERGFLTSPPITLPDASGCGALKLSYCSLLQTTSATSNKSRVLCNGQVIDTVSAQSPLKWRTRTVDLTPFAGQTVRLQWEFDTTATTWHHKLGWEVDNVRISRSEGGSLCIGTGIRVGDFEIFSGRSSAGLLCEHSICCAGDNDPSGACCLPSGGCQVFPSGPECIAAGGAFSGEGTTCEDANCQSRLGACCVQSYDSAGSPISNCTQTSISTCIATGGSFLGIGVQCSNAACTFAACCIEDIGLCTVIPPSLCATLNGRAGPLNSDCGDIQCIPKGVCCLYNGFCTQMTRTECHDNYGIYKGDYTRCGNVTCPPTGACCYSSYGPTGGANGGGGDTCIAVAEWYCNGVLHGRYQGDGTACTNETCTPTGACCVVLGHCISNKTAEQCAFLLGVWRGPGSSCATARCDDRGACCLNPGGCVPLTTEAACKHVLKGTWAGAGVSCGNAGCTQVGACCLPNGECTITTRSLCVGMNGIYRGDNTLCITSNCGRLRACCLPTGGCVVTSEADCINVRGGSWKSSKLTCVNAGCTPPSTGRCCLTNGTCQDNKTADQCAQLGGTWGGAGTSCTSNPCPPPTGRCCAEGQCVENLTLAQCNAANGDWGGAGSVCSSTGCPPTGRCCAEGQCVNNLTQAQCNAANGNWGGAGSTCSSTACQPPTGRCCFNDPALGGSTGNCINNVTQAACQQQGGSWGGSATTCENFPCQSTD